MRRRGRRRTYKSLQIQIIGLLSGFAGVLPNRMMSIQPCALLELGYISLFFLAGTSCINLIKLLIKLWEHRQLKLGVLRCHKLTVSPPPLAPSISSMTTQVGFPPLPNPEPESTAFLIRVVTVAADLSSEALISSAR